MEWLAEVNDQPVLPAVHPLVFFLASSTFFPLKLPLPEGAGDGRAAAGTSSLLRSLFYINVLFSFSEAYRRQWPWR